MQPGFLLAYSVLVVLLVQILVGIKRETSLDFRRYIRTELDALNFVIPFSQVT